MRDEQISMSDEDTRTTLSDSERAQLEALASLSDDSIDLADIPEAPAENWKHARRGPLKGRPEWPFPDSQAVRVDPDLLVWFKDHAPSGQVHDEINRVLRRHVSEAAS